MRLLFLNPGGQIGGAERVLLDLLAGLRAAEPGWSLSLIAGGEGPLVAESRGLGVPASVVPFPSALARLGDAGADGPAGRQLGRVALLARMVTAAPATVAYRSRLARAIGAAAPDAIQTNGFKMHLLGLWARPSGTPLVWHVHDYASARPAMGRLLRSQAGKPAVAVANSADVAADLARVCGARLPVVPVPNGIDLGRFTPEGPALDLDAASGLPPAAPGTVRVGLVATLGLWKGHLTFLEALARLPAGLPVRGYVVGGALYQTRGSQHSLAGLRAAAARLGLGDRVGFTGYVPDSAAAMRALDVVVHASTEPEPFGLVIAEAMACGRAVVASRAGGAAELVRDGVDALAHPPGDAAALAERLARLAVDPELRARLGRAARQAALGRFDRARMAADLAPIYREVVAGRFRALPPVAAEPRAAALE